MPAILKRAAQVKKIVLCYEDRLPAGWLLGLSKLRGKLERAGIEVGGSHLLLRRWRDRAGEAGREWKMSVDLQVAQIHSIPADADIILTYQPLLSKVQLATPKASVIPLSRFTLNSIYDEIVARIARWAESPFPAADVSIVLGPTPSSNPPNLD